MFRKLIGTKEFYKRVLALTIPIMVQNGITNLVNMLDNIMVGRVGTAEMTGVAIGNQLLFVVNLCLFGALAGAGIFGTQFFGNDDHKGVRDTFRFKLVFSLILAGVSIAVLFWGGDTLAKFYLQGEGSPEEAAASLGFSREYLRIMLWGLVPFALSQCYSGTLREIGKPTPPMLAGIVAVCVNMCFNYLLIFGKCGFPELGIRGAAIATVISRFVELGIVAWWTHSHKQEARFIEGVYRHFRIPFALTKKLLRKGASLMVNEALWASGTAVINQSYSLLGLNVVAANNICQTFFNVFSVAFMAVGVSVGIVLGQMLGAGDTKGAKETCWKLIAFSVFVSAISSVLFAVMAFFIPSVYNTAESVRETATALMLITAIVMPIEAFVHASYFTLRSGGKVLLTFFFDCAFMWGIHVPVAFILSRFTSLSILPLFTICELLRLLKGALGYVLVKRGSWIRNLVKEDT